MGRGSPAPGHDGGTAEAEAEPNGDEAVLDLNAGKEGAEKAGGGDMETAGNQVGLEREACMGAREQGTWDMGLLAMMEGPAEAEAEPNGGEAVLDLNAGREGPQRWTHNGTL